MRIATKWSIGAMIALLIMAAMGQGGLSVSAQAEPESSPMIRVGTFEIDQTEVTVGQFVRFVAATGTITKAEREGGGQVFEAGWVQKPGWTWRTPFGQPAVPDEPAVHVTYGEAAAFCEWAGKRLPTDAEWVEAAYTERRESPPSPLVTGQTYPYPTGDSPRGANCLNDCGAVTVEDQSAVLTRGRGHARIMTTAPGINGLYDMGANVWEWVDQGDPAARRTRGGSWWYGAAQMRADHLASKPADTAVVYIGFRCARDVVLTAATPTPAPTIRVSAADAALWARLRDGSSYVVMLRHALAPGTGDPRNFRLDDCSTQRNLSEAGRQQAARLGDLFRQERVPVSRVLSSQWCRCLDTARLMNLAPVEPFAPLNSFFGERSANRDPQTAQVRQFILENRAAPGVIVMVTHQVNITAVTGITTQSGAGVILRAGEDGQIEVVGVLSPE